MHLDIASFSAPCACGRPHAIGLRAVHIGAGALEALPAVIEQLGRPAVIGMIADDNTYRAAGRAVEALLPGLHTICLHPAGLHADEHAVAQVRGLLPAECGLLLAVGAGTIHDITRYVAAEKGIPFLSVPTAPSVDGFVSTVAAMTWHGCKKTFPAVAPVALAADTRVLAACPKRLAASGVGDLLGKYTALFDWKVAHLVTGEYLCSRMVDMEEEAMARVVGSIDGIAAMEGAALEELMGALVLSGLAMQGVGNSRPASGSEHHMSHLWEMHVLNEEVDALHGEKVGVATALLCAYAHGFNRDTVPIPYEGLPVTDIRRRFGALADDILRENEPDPLAAVEERRLLDALPAVWELIDGLPTGEEVAGLLRRCGAPSALADIGLPASVLSPTLAFSPYVRSRLTWLRLTKRLRAR